jgi:hypothetical protein
MLFSLVAAGLEALASLLLLVGVRRDPSLPPSLPPSSLSTPLLGEGNGEEGEVKDVEKGEGGGEGGKEGGTAKKERKASVGRLLALSRPERGLIVLGRGREGGREAGRES